MRREESKLTLTRRTLLGTAAVLAAPAIVRAQGSGTLRIGEINSYTAQPAFTVPYRNGWQLAVEQVNAAGGVLGRKLEVISRDDAGQPQNATRLAGELLGDSHADLLAGGFLSNVGLAISDYAAQNKASVCGGGAADRRAGLGQGQRQHLPPTPGHLHAGRHADRSRRPRCRPSVGSPSRRTTNTASPASNGSSRCWTRSFAPT